jgi:two-component system response regulator YesN
MELITEICKFGNINQIDMEKVFGGDKDIYDHTLKLESAEALQHWLYETCTAMHDLIIEKRQDTTQSFVSKAVEYVEEHFADEDLTIEKICRFLNVSSAYFSTVFKKETGKTFINYLTEYRMQQAVAMLESGNDKTHVIAVKVGYADPNYFSYVFKKQYGISPSKYRIN